MTKIDPLMIEVERLRKRMSEIAVEKGFSSEESVRISQRLDQLLNQIQRDYR
ncbi:aspartyl-phosphate phosphatase Spo0E family protein [Halobacillus yeomjeoni]|uniref:Aspartyl-phosphate phosphatase Spo0E family protein n=1 Tax=Halobacillus yeomjeoni TaxID=311194 RepID=A0A931HT98_9BACI|nr:aspartyl-phosphate phosphatase Spo0E family protein [Halobacillus yeomjeoni]MBH0228949.1 aspartyl-phosphate phosphatase Spo0E family protein [Halobacillus yeomjeoni]MCA0983672.1 aspartyl-phosphate phosphatase Spo0E family protein [Halobacillus yeomjeoni]